MPSFDAINYSLRPSKSIQRRLVFDAAIRTKAALRLVEQAYIGFGSVWFTDFSIAHKELGATAMVSMEKHPIGFRRARFNAPFATVKVLEGSSGELLPGFLGDEQLQIPWMAWLDYDCPLTEDVVEDMRWLVTNAPSKSTIAFTFNGADFKYGAKPAERPDRLRALLGAVVPDELNKTSCMGDTMQSTLADLVLGYLQGQHETSGRPGRLVPATRVIYKDGSPMVTVGGILAEPDDVAMLEAMIADPGWPARPEKALVAPHLTTKEAAHLQAALPSTAKLTRAHVQALGFDLEDEQIEAFEKFYRQYPSYAQIVA